MTTYGCQSKRYLFGANRTGVVADAVQEGFPARLLATASYFVGTDDRLKIFARFGGSSELTLLDVTGGAQPTFHTNNLDTEVALASVSNLLPVSASDWYLSFRIELTTDYRDPNPEDGPNWPFVSNEEVTLYLYRDLLTQSTVVRSEPIDTRLNRAGQPRTTAVPEFVPLKNIQTVFFFADQPVKFRVATAVSDNSGQIKVSLPAGAYDVEFYGGGILEAEYLRGYVVGAGSNLTPWRATSTSGISQQAEFGAVKNQFSSLFWPGYMVAEDFSPERAHLRDETAETTGYGNNLLLQLFGRVFAGRSYIDFLGIAIDPPPE